MSRIAELRSAFHKALCKDTFLLIGDERMPTPADSSNRASVAIAQNLAKALGARSSKTRPSPQTLGSNFQKHCLAFVETAFPLFTHLRPGAWQFFEGRAISQFEQYAHLEAIAAIVEDHPELKSALGGDYIIKPDVIVARGLETDAAINKRADLVDKNIARRAALRKANGGHDLLHASISCKWTIRSDRVQNARAEALNLIRNRKGKLPHVVAVTAEPTPARLASLCYGTGDLDCVYHIALTELRDALVALNYDDALSTLDELVSGRRLKDIADLPLDLAC